MSLDNLMISSYVHLVNKMPLWNVSLNERCLFHAIEVGNSLVFWNSFMGLDGNYILETCYPNEIPLNIVVGLFKLYGVGHEIEGLMWRIRRHNGRKFSYSEFELLNLDDCIGKCSYSDLRVRSSRLFLNICHEFNDEDLLKSIRKLIDYYSVHHRTSSTYPHRAIFNLFKGYVGHIIYNGIACRVCKLIEKEIYFKGEYNGNA